MRKLITLLVIGLVAQHSFSQTQVPENSTSPIYYKEGKVGIGATSPSEKLEVNGNLKINGTGYFDKGLISKNIITHPDNINTSGFFRTNTAPLRYFMQIQHPSSIGYAIQIGNNYQNNELYFRSKAASKWGSLYRIWHNGNANSGSQDWNVKNLIAYNQTDNSPTASYTAKFNAYGMLGNRGSLYITNSGDIRFGIGSAHGANNVMFLNNTGLSIKTGETATETLDINGNIKVSGEIKAKANNGTILSSGTIRMRNSSGIGVIENIGSGNLYIYGGSGNQGNKSIVLGTSYTNDTRVKTDLAVGGTHKPNATLDVAGNIKAQEIEVTLASMDDLNLNGTLAANNITIKTNGQTADFVFDPNYQLKDLSEVETFIKTNKHLENIPSATQMEEKGVNLAEMNKLLLQKVEELTLYSIELERNNSREKEAREKLEERLTKIEALLMRDVEQ